MQRKIDIYFVISLNADGIGAHQWSSLIALREYQLNVRAFLICRKISQSSTAKRDTAHMWREVFTANYI